MGTEHQRKSERSIGNDPTSFRQLYGMLVRLAGAESALLTNAISLNQLYEKAIQYEQKLRTDMTDCQTSINILQYNINVYDKDIAEAILDLKVKEAKKKEHEAKYKVYLFKSGEEFPSVFRTETIYIRVDFKKRGLLCTFKNYMGKIGNVFIKADASWFDGKKLETLEVQDFQQILFHVFREKYLEFQLYVFESLTRPQKRIIHLQEINNDLFPEQLESKAVYVKIDLKGRALFCKFEQIVNGEMKRVDAIIKADVSWFGGKEPEELEAHEFEQTILSLYKEKRLAFQKHVFENLAKERVWKENIYIPLFLLADLRECQKKIRILTDIIPQDRASLQESKDKRAWHLEQKRAYKEKLQKLREELETLREIKEALELQLGIKPQSAMTPEAPAPASAEPEATPAPSNSPAESSSGLFQEGQLVSVSIWKKSGSSPSNRNPGAKRPDLGAHRTSSPQRQLLF